MNEDVREEPRDVFTSGPRDRGVAVTANGDFSTFHVQIYDPILKTDQPPIS